MTENRTGIDRARRLEPKADTENDEDERGNGRQGISKIAEKQTEGIGYVAEKDDEKDDEKTTKMRNQKTLDKGYDEKRIARTTETYKWGDRISR
jgi:hypothetical protein